MGQADARVRSDGLSVASTDKSAIRDAATVLIVRRQAGEATILMGQRGKTAAFMPDKFVFPGGAVDQGDAAIPVDPPLNTRCANRLDQRAAPGRGAALVAAAIREVWEETGLILGRPGRWPGTPPADWRGFAGAGMLPSAAGFRFIFRAITPPGRPRRFDARFFVVDAGQIAGDPDDFTHAEDELRHLQWVPLSRARGINLPFVTEIALAELDKVLKGPDGPPEQVPFFDNSTGEASCHWLV